MLANPDTDAVTGLLDFELAGRSFRVQDILAALYNSTALGAPDWPRRTAAFLRGCASVRCLDPAEVAALPELLIARSLGSVLWRAARWRAGIGSFGEVTQPMPADWRPPHAGSRRTKMLSCPSRPPRTRTPDSLG